VSESKVPLPLALLSLDNEDKIEAQRLPTCAHRFVAAVLTNFRQHSKWQ
jgi:hypothetical protein